MIASESKVLVGVCQESIERQLLWVSRYGGGVSFGPCPPPPDAIPELQGRGYPNGLISSYICDVKNTIHGSYHESGIFRPAYDTLWDQAGRSQRCKVQPSGRLKGIVSLGLFLYNAEYLSLFRPMKRSTRQVCFHIQNELAFQIELFLIGEGSEDAFHKRDCSPGLLNWRIERVLCCLDETLLGVEFCGTARN